MKLFLIIGLLANDDTILLITTCHSNKYKSENGMNDFKMIKAYTHLQINTKVSVKPLLLDYSLVEKSISNISRKEEMKSILLKKIEYTGVAGY